MEIEVTERYDDLERKVDGTISVMDQLFEALKQVLLDADALKMALENLLKAYKDLVDNDKYLDKRIKHLEAVTAGFQKIGSGLN